MKRSFLIAVPCALLLALTIAAVGAPQGEGPRYVDLPGRTDDLPYSHLVVAGNTVYLSGTIGVDEATGVAHTDIDAEIRQVLDNVKERLAHVGLTMDDLVSVQVFCPDPDAVRSFQRHLRDVFRREPAGAGVHRLGTAIAQRKLRGAGGRGHPLTPPENLRRGL